MKAKKVVPRKMTLEKWRNEALKMFEKSGGLVEETKGGLEGLGVLAKAGSDEAREHLCMAGLAVVAILNVLIEGGNTRALNSLRGLGKIVSQTVERHAAPRSR